MHSVSPAFRYRLQSVAGAGETPCDGGDGIGVSTEVDGGTYRCLEGCCGTSEATYVDRVPAEDAPYLMSARLAGEYAARAGAGRLLLTHLWPGTDTAAARGAAEAAFTSPVDVALPSRSYP